MKIFEINENKVIETNTNAEICHVTVKTSRSIKYYCCTQKTLQLQHSNFHSLNSVHILSYVLCDSCFNFILPLTGASGAEYPILSSIFVCTISCIFPLLLCLMSCGLFLVFTGASFDGCGISFLTNRQCSSSIQPFANFYCQAY